MIAWLLLVFALGYFVGKFHLAYRLFKDLAEYEVTGKVSKLAQQFADGVKQSIAALKNRVKA